MRLDDLVRQDAAAPDNQPAPEPGLAADSVVPQPERTSDETLTPAAPALTAQAVTTAGPGSRTPSPDSRPPRGSAPYSPASRAPSTFAHLGWHFTALQNPSFVTWAELPTVNRFLCAIGGLCLAWAALRSAGPPAQEYVRQAAYPYTAAGKQAICATRLSSLARALALYAQDNDGRYPPLDYQTRPGKGGQRRVTWVSLAGNRAGADVLQCPVAPPLPTGGEHLVASYVMNPVLAALRAPQVDDATATLLLAEGGGRHDVALLPPYPTWPSFAARQTTGPKGQATGQNGQNGQAANFDAAQCNVGFRHDGQAEVVYADGHAGQLVAGAWALDSAPWGGSAVLRLSAARIGGRNAVTGAFLKRLNAGDTKGAASYLVTHRAALKPASQDLASLWMLNAGAHASASLETQGWRLARAWQQAGDASFMTRFDQEQTRRCQAELQLVNGGSGESKEVAGRPTLRCQAPATWTAEPETEGRYRRVYLRSHTPSVFALLEVGQRASYVTPRPIDWQGEEQDYQRRYGSGYKRLVLYLTTLGGNAASVWEFEVEKPGGPRLHKRYVGYTDGWASYVFGATAPAKDWELWQPLFDKLAAATQTGDLPAAE